MPYSFSNEIDRFLAIIKPWGRMNGKVTFPQEYDLYGSRWCSSDKNVINWFKRCVDTIFNGNVNCCAVSENIGLIAKIEWEEKKDIVYANIQTLIALEGDLNSLYLDKNEKWQYLRLDLDLKNLGALFRDPLPHIHTNPKKEPRIVFNIGASGNVIMDYLEFIWINYRPDEWISWVEDIWNKKAPEASGMENPFNRIVAAYRDSKIGVLKDHEEALQRLKKYLASTKDSLYPLRLKQEYKILLNYP